MTTYQQQLDEKIQRLNSLLSPFNPPKLDVFHSPEQHYRMRAEFRIWHEGKQISYAMFQAGTKASSASLIRLQDFPTAHQNINQLMPILLQHLSGSPILKNKLYQCEFLTTLNGETLITLIYHRKLDDEWQKAAYNLQQELNIAIIGRSKGQKIVLKQDFVTEQLTVHQQPYHYRQIEGNFSQPNAIICQYMLEWVCEHAQHYPGDLLELYCGNGNFTIPLSRHFNKVLATEISKTSVQAAQWNIQANHANNIALARLSAEEFANAFSGSRTFKRLKNQQIDLQNYQFSTILVDPPRAGIDEQTLSLMSRFKNIIYISCNPDTLCQNLATLIQTHDIEAVALFDQFPFTPHIESGVILKKR